MFEETATKGNEITTLCIFTDRNEPNMKRIGTHVLIDNDLPHYSRDDVTVVWRGVIRNKSMLQNGDLSDEEVILFHYKEYGFYQMLRKIDADFDILFLLDDNIYDVQSFFYVATDSMNRLQSEPIYISGNRVFYQNNQLEPSLKKGERISKACYRKASCMYMVNAEWGFDDNEVNYYILPIPSSVTDYPLTNDIIIHIFQSFLRKAIEKCARDYDTVYLYTAELEEFRPWVSILFETVVHDCKKSVQFIEEKKDFEWPIFSIRPRGNGEIIPFRDRDLLQFLRCLPEPVMQELSGCIF